MIPTKLYNYYSARGAWPTYLPDNILTPNAMEITNNFAPKIFYNTIFLELWDELATEIIYSFGAAQEGVFKSRYT